jgi:hypothetical protein
LKWPELLYTYGGGCHFLSISVEKRKKIQLVHSMVSLWNMVSSACITRVLMGTSVHEQKMQAMHHVATAMGRMHVQKYGTLQYNNMVPAIP